jgi:hypothetical protein
MYVASLAIVVQVMAHLVGQLQAFKHPIDKALVLQVRHARQRKLMCVLLNLECVNTSMLEGCSFARTVMPSVTLQATICTPQRAARGLRTCSVAWFAMCRKSRYAAHIMALTFGRACSQRTQAWTCGRALPQSAWRVCMASVSALRSLPPQFSKCPGCCLPCVLSVHILNAVAWLFACQVLRVSALAHVCLNSTQRMACMTVIQHQCDTCHECAGKIKRVQSGTQTLANPGSHAPSHP